MREIWQKIIPHYRRNTRGWKRALYILGALFLFIIVMDGVIMPIWTRHGDDTFVPKIIGLDLKQAENSLHSAHLRIQVVGEKYEPNFPAKTVITQLPEADTRAKKDRFVKVTLSKGGETVIVPDLSGKSLNQAQLILEEYGLRRGNISYTEIDTLVAGVIVGSHPQSGSKVPIGMIINLVINQAAYGELTTVPDLVGKNLSEARKILERAGLKTGEVEYKVDVALLPKTILGQSPEPGEKVEKGSKIDLIISSLEE